MSEEAAAPERVARPVVLAAPSGTGKTTIARRLVEGSRDFVFSVSATTRPPRPGERNGMDYDFVDDRTFHRMIEEDELVEWARVHGHLYGTPRRNIEEAARRGEHAVLDIDVQGAKQIREKVPYALLLFILPPSAEALVRRLSGRGTEGRRELHRRLTNARGELLEATAFDHAVINADLASALDAVRSLVGGATEHPALAADTQSEVERLRREIDEALVREFGEGAPAPRDETETE